MPPLPPHHNPASAALLDLATTATALTGDELTRYSRQIRLPEMGLAGQLRLKNARVLVLGAGGLGSILLMSLAAAGVGTIGIVDNDTVELSNLARQIIHRSDSIGQTKVESAGHTLRAINPLITIREHNVLFDRNSASALAEEYDLVVDGTDNFSAHFAAADATESRDIPLVWGSVLRFDGMLSTFWPGRGGVRGPGFRDLFPDESAAEDDGAESCETVGVLGTNCAIIAASMASEVLKLLVGTLPSVSGRVLMLDARSSRWREIPLRGQVEPSPGATLTATPQADASARPANTTSTPHISEMSPAQLRERLESGSPGSIRLIDVREHDEFVLGSIPGALNEPLSRLKSSAQLSDASGSIANNTPIVLFCEMGKRSAQAAALLHSAGYTNLTSLGGGIRRWRDSN